MEEEQGTDREHLCEMVVRLDPRKCFAPQRGQRLGAGEVHSDNHVNPSPAERQIL